MACGAKAPKRKEIDEEDKSILRALKEIGKPARPKDIADKSGLNARSVAAKMRKLVNLGLVERVEEGVYKLTAEGEKEAA